MVQEIKEKPTALGKNKFVRLILWIIIILVLVFAANNFWSRYDGQHSFVTKQIEYLENKISTLSQVLPSGSDAGRSVSLLDEKTVMDLQLSDAYFMVRIAATILQNDHDIAAATELLNTAQDHLGNLHGEKFEQAKTILAADIVKLSAVQISDTREIQAKLALLDKLAAVLPLKHEAVDTAKNDTVIKNVELNAADQNRWQHSVQNILAEAKTVVKVRKKPAGDAPLSDVTIEIKRAQFRLLMEQLRWALFYKDADVYKTSISKMLQLLPEIFDADSDVVKQFVSTLMEMSKAPINVDVPNIQESVNALKALLVR